MLRRTFAKTILAACSIPLWPFPQVKERLNNSDLIRKLLKEGKDFSISNKECGWKFNIIRRKPGVNRNKLFIEAEQRLQQRKLPHEKYLQDMEHGKRTDKRQSKHKTNWYRFKISNK